MKGYRNSRQRYLQIIHFEQKEEFERVFVSYNFFLKHKIYKPSSDHVTVSDFDHLPNHNNQTIYTFWVMTFLRSIVLKRKFMEKAGTAQISNLPLEVYRFLAGAARKWARG